MADVPPSRSTHTVAVLEISAAAYSEIRACMVEADQMFRVDGRGADEAIDMSGVAVQSLPDEPRGRFADEIEPGRLRDMAQRMTRALLELFDEADLARNRPGSSLPAHVVRLMAKQGLSEDAREKVAMRVAITRLRGEIGIARQEWEGAADGYEAIEARSRMRGLEKALEIMQKIAGGRPL